MRKLGVGLALAIQLVAPSSSSAQVTVTSKGETVASVRLGQVPIQVKIRTHELPNGTAAKPVKPTDSACTMSRIPCSVVDGVEIEVAGEPLFVPRSAFSDLSDLSTAKVSVNKGKYALTLVGGDASESYVVKIVFSRKRVTYRSLTSSEFPEHPLQETFYHLN